MKRVLVVFLGLSALVTAAAAQEFRLEKVDVQDDAVVIQTTHPAPYTKTKASDPERMILEFKGLRCTNCPREWKGKGRWLQGVRAGQFLEDPPVTRVVLDLAGPVPASESAQGNNVSIRLGSAPAPAPAPAAKAAPAARAAPPVLPAPVAAVKTSRRIGPDAARIVEDYIFDVTTSLAAFAGLAFAALTLGLALYRIRWLRSNLAAVRAEGAHEAHRVEKKIDEDLLMLKRRLSALEAKVSQMQDEAGGAGGTVDPEEIKELRAVMKSLSESSRFPKN